MGLKIEVESKKDDAFTVRVRGSIDTDTHIELKKELQRLFDRKPRSVLLDMEHVDYISSLGFGVIFGFHRRLREVGAKLVICKVKPHITKVFEILKALPTENVFASASEADDYLDRMMRQERGGEAQGR